MTGLPDAYSRGRIIGDYRRIALYGIDYLINEKIEQRNNLTDVMSDDIIRLREETADQINALKLMKKMALAYGDDISKPAKNAREAIQ
jgi:formate C-acetyltransferase